MGAESTDLRPITTMTVRVNSVPAKAKMSQARQIIAQVTGPVHDSPTGRILLAVRGRDGDVAEADRFDPVPETGSVSPEAQILRRGMALA